MTIKATLAAIRALGIQARYNAAYHEYRVSLGLDRTAPTYTEACKRDEDSAYYTNDAEDALATAQRMAPGHCSHCGAVKPVGQSCGCFDNASQ